LLFLFSFTSIKSLTLVYIFAKIKMYCVRFFILAAIEKELGVRIVLFNEGVKKEILWKYQELL